MADNGGKHIQFFLVLIHLPAEKENEESQQSDQNVCNYGVCHDVSFPVQRTSGGSGRE